MRLMVEELQDWIRSKPVHAELRLGKGLGVLVIRALGPGAFLTTCPGCAAWINLPQTRRAEVPHEDALLGPASCAECETDLVVHPNRVEVARMGVPGKRRPMPPKPPREKKPPRRKREAWAEDVPDYEP